MSERPVPIPLLFPPKTTIAEFHAYMEKLGIPRVTYDTKTATFFGHRETDQVSEYARTYWDDEYESTTELPMFLRKQAD